MGGTREGGLRTAETNKAVHGADWYSVIGAKGGSAFTIYPKGFARNKALASIAGSLGGKIGGRSRGNRTLSPATKARYRKEFERNYKALMKVHDKANA